MIKGISNELTKQIAEFTDNYFGPVTLERSVEVINTQAESMLPGDSKNNVYEQTGDLLFAVISMIHNQGWNMERLLQDALIKLQKRRNARHYYEAHITIEPVFDSKLELFKLICHDYKFRVASLLMQKRKEDSEERSKNDSFCTGRGISYTDIETRMFLLVKRLQKEGFTVWRYKIESTLLDSRYDDSKSPLDNKVLPEKEKDPKAPAEGALSGKYIKDSDFKTWGEPEAKE